MSRRFEHQNYTYLYGVYIIYDIFSESDGKSLDDVIVSIDDNFDLAPSQLILSTVEQELIGKIGRESVLLRSIQSY